MLQWLHPSYTEFVESPSPPDPTPVRDPVEVLGKVWLGAPLFLSVVGEDIKPWCRCPRGHGTEALRWLRSAPRGRLAVRDRQDPTREPLDLESSLKLQSC